MNEGEQRIFDIFKQPSDATRAIDQYIQDIQESTMRLIEKPEQHYTREYLLTLTDTELIGLMQGFHQKIQQIKAELQKYGEYFQNHTNPNNTDLSLNFMLIEEAMIKLAKTINIRNISKEILIILLERGTIRLP